MSERKAFSKAEFSCPRCDHWVYAQDVRYEGARMFAKPDMDPHLVRWRRTCRYEWQCEFGLKYLFGTVEHRFGDGATALLAKVFADAASKGAR